jgi:mRNA-degrading endonuclease YafQ of YafQ-DinJ toxin-antitoxin module
MTGFIDSFFYSHSSLQSIITAQINDCLRLTPFLTGLRMSSTVTDLVLIYEAVTSSMNYLRMTSHLRLNHDDRLHQLRVRPL